MTATIILAGLALMFPVPLGVSALRHRLRGGGADWLSADRSSIGHLPSAHATTGAVLRVFAAPTVR